MKSKFWTLVSMVFASAALMACSDDDVVSDPESGGTDGSGEYNTYVNLSISMPQSTDTRTLSEGQTSSEKSNEGQTTETAIAGENTVKSVYIYAFKDPNYVYPSQNTDPRSEDDEWVLADIAQLGSLGDESTTYAKQKVTFTKLSKNPEGAEYHIYVTVNGEALNPDTYEAWPTDGTVTAKDFLENSRFDISKTSHVETSTDNSTSSGVSQGQEYTQKENLNVTSFKVVEDFTGKDNFTKTTALPVLKDFSTTGLVMASRQFDNQSGVGNQNTSYAVMTLYSDNSESNPATATVAVERVMARLDLGLSDGYSQDKLKDLAANTYATVTLDKYFPVNISKEAYLFRHKATVTSSESSTATVSLGGTEIPYKYNNLEDLVSTYWNGKTWSQADYVVDPHTNDKQNKTSYVSDGATYFYNAIHQATVEKTQTTSTGATEVTLSKLCVFNTLLTTTAQLYCLENTTLADCQMKDYSTGIVFAGKLEPATDHIYAYFNGKNILLSDAIDKYEVAVAEVATGYASAASEAESKWKTAKAEVEALKQAVADDLVVMNKAQDAYDEAKALSKKIDDAIAVDPAAYSAEEQAAAKANETATKNALGNNDSGAVKDYNDAVAKLDAANTNTYTGNNSVESLKAAYDEAQAKADAYQYINDLKAAITSDVLYFYNYKFYTTIEALGVDMTLPSGLKKKSTSATAGQTAYDNTVSSRSDPNTKSNIQILYENGVSCYQMDTPASTSTTSGDIAGNSVGKEKDGSTGTVKYATYRAYYHYVIKHYIYDATSEAGLMSPMKFAIVRNNVYQMTVNGVKGLGSGSVDPTDPDPDDTYHPGPTPDEESTMYLDVTLNILNWVLRDQGDIVLK